MPLGQLITAFSRAATTEATDNLLNDILYISYANIMSQVRFVNSWRLLRKVEEFKAVHAFWIANNGDNKMHFYGKQ